MVFLDCFLHPATGFFLLALILPFFRGRLWRWLLFVPSLCAIVLAFRMKLGSYWVLSYVGQNLVLGRVDNLSMSFVILFSLMTFICTIFAFHVREKAHHAASLFYMGAAFGCILAGDYWTLYIFWQFMTVSSAFLIWFSKRPRSAEAGFRYMLLLLLSSVLLLAGILLRQRVTGTFVFSPADAHMMWHFDWLILAAFCINGAVVPLHAWLTDAYPEATIPGAVFLSVFTTNTAVYALARCFVGLDALVILGIVMAVYGAFYALTVNNIRRISAYLMVSQGGFMLAGIGMDTKMGLDGAMALVYAHTFSNALLFISFGCLIHAVKEEHLSRLGGLASKVPFILACTMVGALSMSAMPFLNGFVAIPLILEAAWQESPVSAIALTLALAGTFMAVGLRLPYFAFWSKKPSKGKKHDPLPLNMKAAMVLTSLCCIIQGLFPQLLYRRLPVPLEANPFTLWKILGAFLFLGLTCPVFIFVRRGLTPGTRRLPDFDLVYRFVGRAVMGLLSRPMAWMDGIWTDLYRTVVLRAATGTVRGAGWFDKSGIDKAVDGTARTVLGLGKISARMQTGRLQEMLAWMVLLALGLFGLIWFW
jgi:multicomponent Na+:H+ antiporter subunit D